jgi:hypothetical protein
MDVVRYNTINKLLKSFLTKKSGIEFDMEFLRETPEGDTYKITVYVDPTKKHWVGENYNKKYFDTLSYLDDEIDDILSPWAFDSGVFHDWDYKRTPNSSSFYKELENKIQKSWPNIQKKFDELVQKEKDRIKKRMVALNWEKIQDWVPLPNLLDIPTFVQDTFPQGFEDFFWSMLFSYFAKEDLPIDTFDIQFRGYKDH